MSREHKSAKGEINPIPNGSHSTPGHWRRGYGCREEGTNSCEAAKQARRALRFGGRKEAVGSSGGKGEEAEKGEGRLALA